MADAAAASLGGSVLDGGSSGGGGMHFEYIHSEMYSISYIEAIK